MIESLTFSRQRGAALLIVLLLVATLSFIVMSISDRMILASSRAANARVRAELLWRAHGAEVLVRSAIETAASGAEFRFSPENPFFKAPIEFPMDNGGAIVDFSDATACFNVNALAQSEAASGPGRGDRRIAELESLLNSLEFKDADPKRLAAVIADWIDADSFQTPQGAEDDYYANLPAPYRTGGGVIADPTELRAAAGVSAATYRRMRAFLCALPETELAPVNVNMLTPEAAPVLAALIGEGVSLAAIETAISNRPAAGYSSPDQFWSDAAFAGKNISEEARGRVKLRSKYVEADTAIRYHDQRMMLRLLYEVSDDGKARLVSRRIGSLFE